jgi:hypothetical protein
MNNEKYLTLTPELFKFGLLLSDEAGLHESRSKAPGEIQGFCYSRSKEIYNFDLNWTLERDQVKKSLTSL